MIKFFFLQENFLQEKFEGIVFLGPYKFAIKLILQLDSIISVWNYIGLLKVASQLDMPTGTFLKWCSKFYYWPYNLTVLV